MWGWIVHCVKNYAVFKGRGSRPEYWFFFLFLLLSSIVIHIVAPRGTGLSYPLRLLFWVLTAVPSMAVASRRLHDTGHSFWWLIATYVAISPTVIIGIRLHRPEALEGHRFEAFVILISLLAFFGLVIWLLILYCRKGDAGPNRYGDPVPTTPG
jgi:uncharacterized membrane protein YhaH (DUF805 family)